MLPGKTPGVKDVLQMVRRRLWILVIPPCVTLFAALVYASHIPDLYQSEMIIAIIPQRLPDSMVRTTVTLRTEERLEAIGVDVMSRTSLEQMIKEFDLYPNDRQTVPMQDLITRMRLALDVGLEPVRRGPRGPEPPHAFHVRFTYTDPGIAARVAERLGTMFVEQNAKERGTLARATSRFLESQLAEARQRLEEQERRLEAFREQYGNELPTQVQMNLQAMQSAQMQVQALVESTARDRIQKQMTERLYREALNEPPTVAPVAPTQQGAPGTPAAGATARQQLQAARTTLADLQLRYQPDHPDIIRTKHLIAELEPRAAAEAAAAPAASTAADALITDPTRRESLRQMAAEIESLGRQMTFKETEERRLRASIAEFQRRIEAVPGVESAWVKISRDYETHQTAYKDLLNKSENAKLAVDLEDEQIGEQFRIVDAAGAPATPLRSIRLTVNAAGLAIGLLLGLGLAAFLELRDASFRSDSDVLAVLNIPVLACVPQVITDLEQRKRRRRLLTFAVAGAACLAMAGYVTWTLQLWKTVV